MSNRNVLYVIVLIVATPMLALAQTGPVDPGATGPAGSPYLVGALIGVLNMFTFYFSDSSNMAVMPNLTDFLMTPHT